MASVMFRRMASLRASSSRKNRTWTSLLSGFVGARIMFGLGVLREWWRNEQECKGCYGCCWQRSTITPKSCAPSQTVVASGR